MIESMRMLASWCSASGPTAGGGVFVALLTAGAVGSVMHCAPMCGPFVLGQVSAGLARVPAAVLCERHRLTQGALVPYHLGRLVTYGALGAVAAGSGATLRLLPWSGWLPGVLLLLGATLFLAQALARWAPRWRRWRGASAVPWNRGVAWLASRIDRTRPGGGFLLGVVLGFLPCGLLYAALSVAAAAGDPWRGALAMMLFGLGTVPSLMVLGIAGQSGGRRFNRAVASVAPFVLLLNAAVLGLLAWQELLPA